jgi:hypothetical protein
LHETKKLLPSKRNGHRLKRQPTEWWKSLPAIHLIKD